jgi:hypothetical protein
LYFIHPSDDDVSWSNAHDEMMLGEWGRYWNVLLGYYIRVIEHKQSYQAINLISGVAICE